MPQTSEDLERAVAAVIARLTGWDAESIKAATPLDRLLPQPIMRLIVLRQLVRERLVAPLLDGNISDWVARSGSWVTVESIMAIVREHQPDQG
jgi:hypothetical protein